MRQQNGYITSSRPCNLSFVGEAGDMKAAATVSADHFTTKKMSPTLLYDADNKWWAEAALRLPALMCAEITRQLRNISALLVGVMSV